MATETEIPGTVQDAPPADPRREAVRTASDLGTGAIKGKPEDVMSATDQSLALQWFLGDEEMPMSKTLDVNLGTPDNPRRVPWTIRAIDGETIKNARKQAEEGNRTQKRRAQQQGVIPEVDTTEANARIVVAGSIDPDLRQVAEMKMSAARESQRHPDPDAAAVMVLKHRLQHKPGLIDQIAGEILGLSGYDDDDIQEHQAGKS